VPRRTQYTSFARDYHWLFSDRVRSGRAFYRANLPALKRLRRGGTILDCACGAGLQLAEMLRRGYRVTGSDADAGMVAEARKMAKRNGTPARFVVSKWEGLPRAFRKKFDLVLCCGNSIGHCRNEREMVASLKGMREVMNRGGTVVADTRNWEKDRSAAGSRNTAATHSLEKH